MPDGGGLAVLASRRAASVPDTRFLALSVSDAAEDVIAVIRAGARGYVTKTISAAELADAISGSPTATSCSARGWPASSSTRSATRRAASPSNRPGARPADAARARGAAAARPRLRLQGDRLRAVHLDQDRRDPCLRTCCASCSCPTATNSPDGPTSAASPSFGRTNPGRPAPPRRRR